MTEQGVTYQQVTVAEAAGILGVSVMTVRRMIRRGQLEGERVHRPQGNAYVVKLPVDATALADDAPSTEQPAQNVSRTNGTPSELMAVWSETFLGPIMARMAEQEGTIREQAETIGTLRAELAAARAPQSPPEAPTAPEPADPTTEVAVAHPQAPAPFSWRLILLYVALLVALVASTLMLTFGLY